MSRYWTTHWQNANWMPDVNTPGRPVAAAGGSSFRRRGVSPGDPMYVISLKAGHLYLGARMTVKDIVDRARAIELCETTNLYPADEWVVDPAREGTDLHLERRLAPEVTKALEFITQKGVGPLVFVSDSALDNQATRGLRELTKSSAALLDRIIAATDPPAMAHGPVTVTAALLEGRQSHDEMDDDVASSAEGPDFDEGTKRDGWRSFRDRASGARRMCIAHHGLECAACGIGFERMYGPLGAGFIHVHHLNPLAVSDDPRPVDPIKDLVPICPNCHAMVHRRTPPVSIVELRATIEEQRKTPSGRRQIASVVPRGTEPTPEV